MTPVDMLPLTKLFIVAWLLMPVIAACIGIVIVMRAFFPPKRRKR